jgi:hypothetical protein
LIRLTTNPDCPSRLSTLQSAHKPVRGQSELVGVLVAVFWGRGALTSMAAVAVALSAASSREERVQATRAVEASRIRAKRFLIETQR